MFARYMSKFLPLNTAASCWLSFHKVTWKELIGFILECEVRQNPASAGHLEIEAKIHEAEIFDVGIKNDLAKGVVVILVDWPAPGSEDTELGVLMELEVGHGETEVYAGVQA